MAMIICKECRKSFSQHAMACPACGKPNHYKPRPKDPASKPWTIWAMVVIVPVFVFVMASHDSSSRTAPAEPSIDPEQQTRINKASAAAIALKFQMRDPDSFRTNLVLTDDTADTICIQYQAKNGFGGLDQAQYIYAKGQSLSNWDRWCSPHMHNLTSFTR
jgi:DNA-directed RNA polymerase subunit RPC12/RpoP